jgi:glycosyltransferase involved in cell wall biosynthesis
VCREGRLGLARGFHSGVSSARGLVRARAGCEPWSYCGVEGSIDASEVEAIEPQLRPAVTIIIPTRNRRRFLEQSVRDALRQVDVEFEVLVVDDGSRDPDAVRSIEALDPRIRVIRHDRRGGVARARNTGLANAVGTWSAFFDDDDRWAPTKLRAQLAAAEAAQAPWVYCAAATIDERDRVLFVGKPGRPSTSDWLGIVNPVPGGCSNVVVRTELAREAGGFDERLAMLADWDLWIRLAAKAAPAVSDEVLSAYRLHPGNMHIRRVEEVDAELDYLGQKHLPAGERGRRDHFGSSALAWRAKAYRRAGRRGRAAGLFLRRWWITRDARDLAQAALTPFGDRTISAIRRRWTRGDMPYPDWLDTGADSPSAVPAGPAS